MKASITLEKPTLQDAIDELLAAMGNEVPDSPEYARMADQLVKLYALKEIDVKVNAGTRVSPDTWAVIGANLAGILIIVGHERAHLVTSKALNFLLKLR